MMVHLRAAGAALAVLAFCLCLPLAAQETGSDAGEATTADTTVETRADSLSASELIAGAQKGVGAIIKAARESKDPKLEPDKADAKPFWQAVKRANESLDKAERGLYLKDETFHGALGDAASAIAEAEVTLEMTGSEVAEVQEALTQTEAAVALLVKGYGKESARLKQGGELTEAERDQLEKLKDDQAKLQRKLAELEGKVGANSYLIDGVQRAQRESQKISNVNYTTSGFVDAMVTINILRGWMWGWHWWWGPWAPWCQGYVYGFNHFYHDTIIIIDYDWDLIDDYVDFEDIEYVADLYDLGDVDDIGDLDFDYEVSPFEADHVDDFLETHSFDLEGSEHLDLVPNDIQYEMNLGNDYTNTMDLPPEVDFYEPQGIPMDSYDLDSFDDGFDFDAGGPDAGGFDAGGFDSDW